MEDSATAKVTRRPDSNETLADKSLRILDETFTTASETIAAASETLIAATEEFTRTDTGKQISDWGHQAQIAFEDQVLTQIDLEKLFDGFGEEGPDVISE